MGALRSVLDEMRRQELELPEGCSITYQLEMHRNTGKFTEAGPVRGRDGNFLQRLFGTTRGSADRG